MSRHFVNLTSDSEIQSQGVGILKGVILTIYPEAIAIHLMHVLPNFNITPTS